MRSPARILIISLIMIFTTTSLFAFGWQNSKKTGNTVAARANDDKDIPTGARIKMEDLPKYDPKEEAALLREINTELESYLPQLKEHNERLRARADEVEKENASLKEETQKLRSEKGSKVSAEDLARLEKDNAALRAAAEEAKSRAKALETDKEKVIKQKAIVESALKDQQNLITEEVNQMRKDNEDLFQKTAELKKANAELETCAAKLKEMNAMFKAALEKKSKEE